MEALEAREVPTTFGATRGLSVAHADVIPDPLFVDTEYITGTGPGRPALVRVWNSSGDLLSSFRPFGPSYRGGAIVTAGDVDLDFQDELIVSTAGGTNGRVRIYKYTNGGLQFLTEFTPLGPTYSGSVQIISANVTGDRADEIIVGQGNGGSRVKVFSFDPNVSTVAQIRSFLAYEDGYKGGVTVGAGNIHTTFLGSGDPNNYAEIITGKASQLPLVRIFDAQLPDVTRLAQYMAFNINNPANRRGIDVVAGNTDGLRGVEIYVALRNSGTVRFFRGETGAIIGTIRPFPPGYSRNVNFAINDSGDDFFNLVRIENLIVVAADGPFTQVPIIYDGAFNSPAGLNGSRPAA